MKYILSFLLSFPLYSFAQESSDFELKKIYTEEAQKLLENKDYKGVMNSSNKLIELEPDYKWGYMLRGTAKGGLKDFRGAISDYNKAIIIDPNFTMAYFNRGLANAFLSNHIDAISDFTKAISLDDKYTAAYFYRGLSLILKPWPSSIEKNEGCLDLSKAGELGELRAYDKIAMYCQ
jgi:tetratricopeptide (TPR) repeat protein